MNLTAADVTKSSLVVATEKLRMLRRQSSWNGGGRPLLSTVSLLTVADHSRPRHSLLSAAAAAAARLSIVSPAHCAVSIRHGTPPANQLTTSPEAARDSTLTCRRRLMSQLSVIKRSSWQNNAHLADVTWSHSLSSTRLLISFAFIEDGWLSSNTPWIVLIGPRKREKRTCRLPGLTDDVFEFAI